MDRVGEPIPVGFLASTVVESELGVGDTTVETRLRIWLVFLVSVALGGSSSHLLENNNLTM